MVAAEKLLDRRQALIGYLNARREFYGDYGIELASLCADSLMFRNETPKNERTFLNRYEKALVRLSNQARHNLQMHPVWLASKTDGDL